MGSLVVIPLLGFMGAVWIGYNVILLVLLILTILFGVFRMVKKKFTKTCIVLLIITILMGIGEYFVIYRVMHYDEIQHQELVKEEGKELVAIRENNIHAVREYLENGWNPNETTKAVYYAIRYNPEEQKEQDQWEMLDLLLKYGAEPDVQIEENPKGVNTPLTYTTECGYYGATKLLLEYGASPNYQENCSQENGLLALRFYENEVAKETLELLLQAGTNLEIADESGKTGREKLENFEKDYESVREKVPQYDEIVSVIQNKLKEEKE